MSDIYDLYEFDELIADIYKKYDEERASKTIKDLMQHISSGKGTYKDLYDYTSELGNGLGRILKDRISSWGYLDHREEMKEKVNSFLEVLEKYHDDITDASDLVQKAINEGMGVHLAPRHAAFNDKRAGEIVGHIIEAETGTLEKEVENFGMKAVDDTIHENVDFLSRTGFSMKVVREYDNVGVHTQRSAKGGQPWKKDCEWCKERAGVYNYEDVKETGNKVWQRHEGCGCSIDFYNKNGKRNTVNNFVRMSKRKIKEINRIKKYELSDIMKSEENIPMDLQFFASKPSGRKVPKDNPLWDSLASGDRDWQRKNGIFDWEHGGYDYVIQFDEDYEYRILSKRKKKNIHE